MKQKTSRAGAKPGKRNAVLPMEEGGRFRWHAGYFRTALILAIVAIGILLIFGPRSDGLAQWLVRDGYVATRATVVKVPFWADALEAKSDQSDAVAGWHVELRVGDYPFTLPVGLGDFDPDRNYFDQKNVPDVNRFAVGSVHPVWFYADNKMKQPETVALLQSKPVLIISRAAFSRFPTLREALEDNVELLIAPALLLLFAVIYMVSAFRGKRNVDTAGSPLATRITYAFVACLVAGGTYLVNNEHSLAVHKDQYVPAEIEITRAPLPEDKLTFYGGYRVLWRTWQVQAKLAAPDSAGFTIDVDGLDPRRAPWASRHSPDFSKFQPGTKLAVWQSNFHSATLNSLGSLKPTIPWDSYLSRERWPEKYTLRDFVKDNPVATTIIGIALMLAVIWLLPLGGRRTL